MGVAGGPFGDLTFCQKSGCTCQMPFFGTFNNNNNKIVIYKPLKLCT